MPWVKPVGTTAVYGAPSSSIATYGKVGGTIDRWVSIVPVVSNVQVDFALIVAGSNEWAKWIVMDMNDTSATIRDGVIAGSYPPAEVA